MRDQLAPATQTGLGEDRLEVVLDGVGRDGEGCRDVLRGEPLKEKRSELAFPASEVVRLREEVEDLVGCRAADRDDDAAAVGTLEQGTLEHGPTSRTGANSHGGGETVGGGRRREDARAELVERG